MKLKIIRLYGGDEGTFGALLWKNMYPFCTTLEDPWRDNKIGISCIPAGVYRCVRTHSPKFGNTFLVTDTEPRTHILFHKGNTQEDTRGCILLGRGYGKISGKHAVIQSTVAFEEFLKRLEGKNEFELTIV